MVSLPGFQGTTTNRTRILDAAVRQVFEQLAENGVPTRRFDEIAVVASGGTPRRDTPEYHGGSIPWAKITDITSAGKWIGETEETITREGLESSAARLFPAGTVLFSMYGSIGKTSIVQRPMATNQAILGLVPNPGIDSEFVYYALIYSREALFSRAQGTSQANINGALVKSFRVPVPDPDSSKALIRYFRMLEEGGDLYARNLSSRMRRSSLVFSEQAPLCRAC